MRPRVIVFALVATAVTVALVLPSAGAKPPKPTTTTRPKPTTTTRPKPTTTRPKPPHHTPQAHHDHTPQAHDHYGRSHDHFKLDDHYGRSYDDGRADHDDDHNNASTGPKHLPHRFRVRHGSGVHLLRRHHDP